ncbi:hypothetical protein JK361_26285 [Streptomyces sp. 5-8]|uniref:Collagen alpha 1(II) chain n=1 Tax=Streptomyces musisoli TaxID=2802280 RepID=A0ABS1P815_9ACTN|nr:hypothetical protein [Streptomyces musisoli]MBL1108056.1 hypothetical protein [Streptomyces musisoli]
MSDDWKQKPEYKSAAQQVDKEVGEQVAPITTAQGMLAHMPFFGGGVRVNLVGSTNFEDHDLNDMIDLVEHANPEHLESTSKSLFDAGKAIRKAATDLEQHLKVDWKGEGADSFHDWTRLLIQYTNGLAGYADEAGTHISVAATGLASARTAMPPRDTRPADEQKRPTELPKAKQVDSNPDYAAAVKAEKNRQEAINQMNRLASYYKVAATDLSKQKEPEPLKPITDVGVPPATFVDDRKQHYGSGASAAASTPSTAVRGDVGGGHAHTATPNGTEANGHVPHVPPIREVHEPTGPSGHDVGTEINTTTTLPPQVPASPPTPQTPTLPTTGGGGWQTPPVPPGPMTPPVTPTGRTPGYGPAGRPPVTAQGRTGPSGTGSGRVPQGPVGRTVAGGRAPQGPMSQAGRSVPGGRTPQGPIGQAGRSVPGGRTPQGPMGQAARAMGRTPTGQPGARGPVQSGRAPMGRSVTGGTPKTTSTPGGRTGATGPATPARNGVVGGKPVTGRTSGGTTNPRVPRGMVVGAEEPTSSTPSKGTIGQRGVVGAPTAKTNPGTGQGVLRSAGNPEGVIGAPRNSAKGADSSGAGLGRGAVGNSQAPSGETGRTGGTADRDQRRSAQQRRDESQTSD